MQIAVKRSKTVRAQTAHGINERIKRYRLSEQCAELTPEVIAFWAKVLRNEPREVIRNGKRLLVRDYTTDDQFKAGDRLMDRAYGKPPMAVQIDGRQQQLKQIIHTVRWLPPDPNDHSRVIEPEPCLPDPNDGSTVIKPEP
jgi:hypothetical protein